MKDPEFNALVEASWHRRLTPDEEARLRSFCAAHPEAQAICEEDFALTRHLDQLPAAPVPSNFTARVLQTVALEESRAARAQATAPTTTWWRVLVPRLAAAGAAIVIGVLGYGEYRNYTHAQLARGASTMSEPVAALPSPEIFQDFEAIRELRKLPLVADEELLAALK